MTSEDGLLSLYTGLHAMRRSLPPVLVYREDHPATVMWLTALQPFAKEHSLAYFNFAGVDTRQGVGDEDSTAIEKSIRSSASLKPLFQAGSTAVYGFATE